MTRIIQDNKKLIITGIFLSIFIIGTTLILNTPSNITITYGLSTQTTDESQETISFNVFEPIGGTTNKKVILIGHGVMVSKEMLKGYAIELAASGFVAVPFDFRGHGYSSGLLQLDLLTEDVKAVKQYMIDEYDIDPNNFGYIGYSMGGEPGYKVVKNDTAFKCFIGVGTGLATTAGDDVLYTNDTRDLNVLMIHAQFDEAFTLEGVKTGMGLRMNISSDNVDANKLYGSFSDGNASKIFLDDNTDHLTLGWDQDFIRQARDWVINTFPDVSAPDENFYVNSRMLLLIIQLIGGIGFFFSIIGPISGKIIKYKEENAFKIELQSVQEEKLEVILKQGLIYPLLFGIIGMICMSWLFITPISIGAAVSALLSGEAFGFLVLIRKYAKGEEKSVVEILKSPFKRNRDDLIREIILGVILMVILALILYLSVTLNFININISIFKFGWTFLFYPVIFCIIILFSMMMQGVLQQKIENTNKGIFKLCMISFGFNMSYLLFFIGGLCLLIQNYFAMLIIYVFGPFALLMVFVSAIVYKKTGSLIPGAMINALYLSGMALAFSPYGNALSLVMQLFFRFF